MLVTYALTVRLLSVQQMQLLTGKDSKGSLPKQHKSRKNRNIVKTSSITDPCDASTDISLVDSELTNRSHKENKSNTSINKTSNPMRRSPTVSYHSPQNARLAQLRAKRSYSTSKRPVDTNLELTVFSDNEIQNKDTRRASTYSLRIPNRSPSEHSNPSFSSSVVIPTVECTDAENIDANEVPLTVGEELDCLKITDTDENTEDYTHCKGPTCNTNLPSVSATSPARTTSPDRTTSPPGREDRECGSTDINGTPVNVPCSCAPR